METDPGTHWAILFLYFYENQMMAELASNDKTKFWMSHSCCFIHVFFLKKLLLVLLVFLYLLLIVLISNMIKLLQAENGILTLKEEKSRKEWA